MPSKSPDTDENRRPANAAGTTLAQLARRFVTDARVLVVKSFATIKNVVFATLLRIETSANFFTELCYGAILSLMINVGRMIIMAKKVVVISTSLRANSNSDKLAQISEHSQIIHAFL